MPGTAEQLPSLHPGVGTLLAVLTALSDVLNRGVLFEWLRNGPSSSFSSAQQPPVITLLSQTVLPVLAV